MKNRRLGFGVVCGAFLVTALASAQAKELTKAEKEAALKKLSPLELEVTQKSGTEPPFKNKYWNNKEEGIYVDIVSGEPLFSSLDKYDSGTGWPSFTRPISAENIHTREDNTLFSKRTEVRSKKGDSHLGHVFEDGPPSTGLRYCMNSASMRFIPRSELKAQGYGEWEKLFSSPKSNEKKAIFAGGCFWCMEPPFDVLKGVIATTSGYAGGKKVNPTYEEVSAGTTGHQEVIQITYDANLISYSQLLDVYWKNIDPLDSTGQFCDKGEQYKSAIFAANPEEKKAAEESMKKIEKSLGKKIATKILDGAVFYPAEQYHQDYYEKNPVRYKFYRYNCGRDKRLNEVWGSKR